VVAFAAVPGGVWGGGCGGNYMGKGLGSVILRLTTRSSQLLPAAARDARIARTRAHATNEETLKRKKAYDCATPPPPHTHKHMHTKLTLRRDGGSLHRHGDGSGTPVRAPAHATAVHNRWWGTAEARRG
jgi:hypothetical protein